jgi:hypothetical protein
MSKFQKWDEYFNARGSMVAKPAVVTVPDYEGPNDSSPAVVKVKGVETPKAPGKHAAYRTSTKAVVPPGIKGGLGFEGKPASKHPETKLVPGEEGTFVKNQWPNNKSHKKVARMVSKAGVRTWPKTKTEQFIDKTKDMSITEFTAYMLKECGCQAAQMEDEDTLPMVTAYATGKFHPHPPEAIRYVVALAKANPRIMDNLIHEMKRAGALDSLLGTTMDHPETFDHLTDILSDDEDGPKHSRAFARSMDDKFSQFQDEQDDMYESVGPPFGMGYNDEEEEDDDQSPSPALGDDEEDQQSPSPEDDDNLGGDEEGEDEMGPEDDEEGLPDPAEDPAYSDGPPAPEQGPDQTPEESPRKLKKKFAHDHLIGAMSEYPHMREKMKGF